LESEKVTMTKRIEERVGQMLMAGFDGLAAPAYFLDWLREGRLGGVILFARNVASPAQVAALTTQLHAASRYPLLIGIDQEGGTVARLRDGFSESPGAMALASIREQGETVTETVSGVLAREMDALGINWTYAPTVDISLNAANPSVGTRSFGSNPERVAKLAAAAVRGFQGNGVAACAKHFPGLGDTALDTHLHLPRLNASLERLLAADMLPYQAAIASGLATIMTTHTIFNALDTDFPATLSKTIVNRLIRDELRFSGVVSTDCMEMKAIDNHFGVAESVVLAANAGIDIILFSHTREKQAAAYDHLLAAVKRGDVPEALVDAANERIAALKTRFPAGAADISRICTDAHQQTTFAAARAAVTRVRAEAGVLPLLPDDTRRVLVLEFSPAVDSLIQEAEAQTPLHRFIKAHLPNAKMVTLPASPTPQQVATVAEYPADVRVIATRSAHLNPRQAEAVRKLAQTSAAVVLLALRNPYDAALLESGTVLCTLGDSLPSLAAAGEALAGLFEPSGVLPVEV
jgi:beta-N-acetylhexosaminidase